jgi:serine/threonine-protein kinase
VTAALQHPHILPLFDSGEADGMIYYAMPYVKGETLRARLQHEHQLPVEDAVEIARAVASALDYAHRHGVIHRDIKPENILFQDGQAVVTDFGIALALSTIADDRLTEAGLSMGTPYYMSPEQATGDRTLDARTDIYSLGCVLYEMLTGEPPFTGRTAQSVVGRILTEHPREVRQLRDSAPVALDRAVLKALARLPADRYATAAKFGEALVRAAAEPWATSPHDQVTPGAIAPPRQRRRPPPHGGPQHSYCRGRSNGGRRSLRGAGDRLGGVPQRDVLRGYHRGGAGGASLTVRGRRRDETRPPLPATRA